MYYTRISTKRIIKITLSGLGLLLLAGLLFLTGVYIKYRHIVKAEPRQLTGAAKPGLTLVSAVNPFIGTGGFHWVCGHNFPGASVPFGMVRLGPETISLLTRRKALNTSGYFYRDLRMLGVSHTRLCGTGAKEGGHFLVVPLSRPMAGKKRPKIPVHRFSHIDEMAFPGYYAVYLAGPQVLAEMTATGRVGVHRYTFSDGKDPRLFIDVCHTLGDGRSSGCRVEILPEAFEIAGTVRTFGSFSKRYGGINVYFVARFSHAFDTFGIWRKGNFHPGLELAEGDDIGIELGFTENSSTGSIGLKLAISYVSVKNARENLEIEAGDQSFEEILAAAQHSWEDRLSLIRISGTTQSQKEIFYTALYRAFQMPGVFSDVNGEYLGFDRQVHQSAGFRYFTDLSLWDTFRTLHPLYSVIAPGDQRDMMVSLVRMAREGGWLPRWPSGNGYTGSMLGTPADITIADAWLKGIRDFDIEFAYQSMRETALGPTPEGAGFPGRRGIGPYLAYGYCPADMMDEAVSKTLEYAWADHAIGQLAESLGKQDDAKLFGKHAGFYRNIWNPETMYFHPRNSGGDFISDFKPLLLTYFDRKGEYTDDYVEGSALQWRWAVPFDPRGLISLFGNPEYFVTELNDFFALSDPSMGRWNPGPYYWHGNEPDIHAAYLFNEAGRPDLTQKWVRWVLDHKYGTGYDGLDGNDDGATLSAWYIFSSLGFYPVAGTDVYQLGTPLFREVEIDMDGKILRIEAENYTPDNFYVDQVRLNDAVLDRTWIRHSEIAGGGILSFKMSDAPVKLK